MFLTSSFSRIRVAVLCLVMAAALFAAPAARADDGIPNEVPYGPATYHVSLRSAVPLEKGELAQVSMTLTDADGDGVLPGRLAALDGDKLHVFVVDESLLDFQDLMPRPSGAPGRFIFGFIPKTSHNYRVFVNLRPKGKPAQDIPALLKGKDPCGKYCVNIMSADRAKLPGYNVYVTLNRDTVHVGEDVIGTLHIIGSKEGAPVIGLQPVKDAFAYLVGFYDDFKTVAHMTVVSDGPRKDTDIGASPILFVLHPARRGYLKYYAAFRIKGQDYLVPFGLRVVKPGVSLPDIRKVLSRMPPDQ